MLCESLRFQLQMEHAACMWSEHRWRGGRAACATSPDTAAVTLENSIPTRRRISINTYLLHARGLDADGRAGAGCEPEASTKAAPQLPEKVPVKSKTATSKELDTKEQYLTRFKYFFKSFNCGIIRFFDSSNQFLYFFFV